MRSKVAKMMVKAFVLIMLIVPLILANSAEIKAANPTSGEFGDGLTWSYNEDSKTLTISGNGAIPASGSGSQPWGSYKNEITTIVVGEGITAIGEQAFYSYDAMTTFTAKGNLNIEVKAFYCCDNLENFSAKQVGDIGEKAFANCQKLESFVSETSIGNIGKEAFTGDSYAGYKYLINLTTFSAKDGVGSIDQSAFSRCSGLTEITFSDKAESISDYAFFNCTSLKSVVLGENLSEIKGYAFSGCENIEVVEIKCDKAMVLDYAFSGCSKLSKVIAPKTVSYGKSAFNDTLWDFYFGKCGDNVYWIIEDDVLTIFGNGAMTSAPKWRDVNNDLLKIDELPIYDVENAVVESGITSIYASTFASSTSLPYTKQIESITIPNTVTVINNSAFKGAGIKEFTIPSSVTTIGDEVFAETANLQKLTIPETVTSLGKTILKKSAVSQLTLDADIIYNYSMFQGYEYSDNLETLIINNGTIGNDTFSYKRTLKSVTFGEGVDAIGEKAFMGCEGIQITDIPANVETIGDCAFMNCTGITDVIFREGLTSIGKFAYLNCTLLEEATIPISVTAIGEYAFNGIAGDAEYDKESIRPKPGDEFTIKGVINTEAERYARDTRNVTFYAIGGKLEDCPMTFSPSSFTYDGNAKTPTVKVTTPLSKTVLVEGIHYTTPVFSNNVNVGKASVTVSALPPLVGSRVGEFTINEETSSGGNTGTDDTESDDLMREFYYYLIDLGLIGSAELEDGISGAEEYAAIEMGVIHFAEETGVIISVEEFIAWIGKTTAVKKEFGKVAFTSSNKVTYNGKYQRPSITVRNTDDDKLTLDKHYTLSGTRKSVGRKTVTITGIGEYEGQKATLTFTVVPKAPTTVTAKLYGYNDIAVSWSKCTGASGYYVYYKKSTSKSYTLLERSGDTSAKKANLTDGAKYYFKIVPYYKSGETRYSSLSYKTANIYTLKKLSIPTAKRSDTKVKVSWQNINGETGYQVYKMSKKNGKYSVVSSIRTSKTYYSFTATKGKYYYYKVRAYKTVDGKRVYGPWSSVKSFKR